MNIPKQEAFASKVNNVKEGTVALFTFLERKEQKNETRNCFGSRKQKLLQKLS